MRLIRNTTPDGRCKYALVRLDKLRKLPPESLIAQDAAKALDALAAHGLLEYAGKNDPEEAFVIKLKDHNAPFTLRAYAASSHQLDKDQQYFNEVCELAIRAEKMSNRKRPD